MTIFDQVGGDSSVEALVELFYRKVLSDNNVNYFFKGLNIQRIKNHQMQFFKYVLGGADKYTGPQLRKAHQRLVEELGLSEKHFIIVATHLNNSLEELGVETIIIEKILAIVSTTKSDVLNE